MSPKSADAFEGSQMTWQANGHGQITITSLLPLHLPVLKGREGMGRNGREWKEWNEWKGMEGME